MKLTEKQVELLKIVRENFESIDYERRTAYICIEANRAAFDTHADPIEKSERAEAYLEICNIVREAISHFNNMESWLIRQYPRYANIGAYEQYRIMYLARCAWLDRMIETGECA
jgi:hypothetical protein